MNKRIKDITGKVFGQLTALSFSHLNQKGHAVWICNCSCGKQVQIIGSYMRSGWTNSCGCYKRQEMSKRMKKHGLSGKNTSKEYAAWSAMIQRCHNQNHKYYSHYGGRGIKVCERWRLSFENFLSDMGECQIDGGSLDRYPDNNGDYELANCRWVNQKSQCNNRRSNIVITHNGATLTLNQWCEKLSINYQKIWHLLKRKGQSFEQALKGLEITTT